jgi:hypothetical protein
MWRRLTGRMLLGVSMEYRVAVPSASRSTARCNRWVFRAMTQLVTSLRASEVVVVTQYDRGRYVL